MYNLSYGFPVYNVNNVP